MRIEGIFLRLLADLFCADSTGRKSVRADLWNGIAGEHPESRVSIRIEFDLHATQTEILHDGLVSKI